MSTTPTPNAPPELHPYNVRVTYRERRSDGSVQGVTFKCVAANEEHAEDMTRRVWHPQTVDTVTAHPSSDPADLAYAATVNARRP